MKWWLRGLIVFGAGALCVYYGVDAKKESATYVGLAVAFVGLCTMAWMMLLGGVRALGKAMRGE